MNTDWRIIYATSKHRDFVIVRKARQLVDVADYVDNEWIPHRYKHGRMQYRQIPLDDDHEDVYEYWYKMLRKVNDANWRFNLSHWNQPIHIGEYKEGGEFPVHTDYGSTDASKLAFVQLLPSAFSGGRLWIAGKHVDLHPGDAVIFPSYMPHEVRTVSSGTRYALAGWASGPRFI